MRDRGSILIRDAQISEDSHGVVAVAFTALISGTPGEFRGHQPTDTLERHYLVWSRGWAKKLRRAVDQFADHYEQGIAEGQALEETWSGLAIKHFAARGGELVHLVLWFISSVWFFWFIWFDERERPDSPADLLALLPYAISHMLFSSCPPLAQGSGTLPPNQYHHHPTPRPALRFPQAPPRMAPMPFSIRLFRRFPVHCSVSYNAGPFQGQGTVWNLSCTGWRLSGDLPMRPGETLSLTVTLPNKQRIVVPEAVVRWSRGQEFAVENLLMEPHTHARLQHYVNRLVQEPAESIP